ESVGVMSGYFSLATFVSFAGAIFLIGLVAVQRAERRPHSKSRLSLKTVIDSDLHLLANHYAERKLEEALRASSPREREIFSLAYNGDLTVLEVADQIGTVPAEVDRAIQ